MNFMLKSIAKSITEGYWIWQLLIIAVSLMFYLVSKHKIDDE